MHTMFESKTFRVLPFLLLVLILWLSVPSVADAQRYSYRDSSSAVNKLDDDEVEEFSIPVLFGVDLSRITPGFGDPRDGGTREHEGQDIMAPEGTPIVSPTEAVVLSTGDGEGSGFYVRTANPGGEQFVYMHLSKIADLDRGSTIDVGDVIGYVGETGNAQGTTPHLHLEVRDGGKATDPYDRLEGAFTLKERMEYLKNVFSDTSKDADMAEFLVETFRSDFMAALAQNLDLPSAIEEELEDRGLLASRDLLAQLQKIIASIPSVVTTDLKLNDQSVAVGLMQTYLIQNGVGPKTAALKAAGATGYFGPATEAAIKEYQEEQDIKETGVYDAATRKAMLADD